MITANFWVSEILGFLRYNLLMYRQCDAGCNIGIIIVECDIGMLRVDQMSSDC